MLNKQQEKVLKYILSFERKATNKISIGKYNYSLSDVSIKEFISCVNILEHSNMIQVRWYGNQKDNINIAIDITILPNGMNYFDNKKSVRRKNTKDNIKWIIPLIISILSLIWNICNTLMYSALKDYLLNQ
jgi:hypothetical protein